MWRHSKLYEPASGAPLGALAALATRLPARAEPRVALEAVIMEDRSSCHR